MNAIETIRVSWYQGLDSYVQELQYSGFDNAKASAFRRLSEDEQSALVAEYSAAYEGRFSLFKGEREDSFSLSLRGRVFRGELYCTDRAYDIWTTALVAPSGRVFVRHFGDTEELSAFVSAELN